MRPQRRWRQNWRFRFWFWWQSHSLMERFAWCYEHSTPVLHVIEIVLLFILILLIVR
jgi:hypothetical protein